MLFDKELYLSYESISLEIMAHVNAYKASENSPNSSLNIHSKYIDIGNGYMDKNIEFDRYVWDFFSLIRG